MCFLTEATDNSISITDYKCFFVCIYFISLIVQFVSKSLDEVDSDDWACSLGAEMAAQIPLYTNLAEEKVCYNCTTLIVL